MITFFKLPGKKTGDPCLEGFITACDHQGTRQAQVPCCTNLRFDVLLEAKRYGKIIKKIQRTDAEKASPDDAVAGLVILSTKYIT